jgi:hypothetical protein
MAPPDIWLDLGLRSCGVSPVPQYPCTPRLQCRRCNHTAARHTSLHERKYLGSMLMFNATSDSRAEGMGGIDRVDLEVRFSRPRLIISSRRPLQAQQFLDYAVSRWREFTIECRRHWICGGAKRRRHLCCPAISITKQCDNGLQCGCRQLGEAEMSWMWLR